MKKTTKNHAVETQEKNRKQMKKRNKTYTRISDKINDTKIATSK